MGRGRGGGKRGGLEETRWAEVGLGRLGWEGWAGRGIEGGEGASGRVRKKDWEWEGEGWG